MRTNPDSPTRAPSGRIIWAVIALILLPLIPIAVGINFLGISDRLDHIPGISKGGGLTSAVVALVVVGVIFGVAVGGIGMFAGGDDGPAINATSTPTPEPTDMPVPTATPSPTPLTTPTATPTPSTAELQADYLALKENYFQEFPEPDDTTPEVLGADVHDDELWVVFDETDVFENGTRMRLEWTTITNGYLHALDDHHGHTTERMRAVGWNDTGPISTFSVTTEDALDHINGNTTYETYYQNWFRTVRATTDEERRIARETANHTPRD